MSEEKKDLTSLVNLPPDEPSGEPGGELKLDPPSPETVEEPVSLPENDLAEAFKPLTETLQAADIPPPEAPLEEFGAPAFQREVLKEQTLSITEIAVETALTATLSTSEPLDSIKTYSESLATTAMTTVAASFPFSLKIEGKLSPEDTEKLLSILARENMGFREVDLEPQIAEGKILIPRISEYAGILLIQALRAIPAKLSFAPADEIFSTPDTRDETDGVRAVWTEQDSLAENLVLQDIPVSTSDSLPQFAKIEALDALIASGLLTTKAVEAAYSDEYTLLVEALMRELKFKARRRGANGIISLQITLTPLTLPTDYRLTVSATAVRGAS